MRLKIGPHTLEVAAGFEPLVVALGGKVDEAPGIAMMPTAKGAMVRRNIVIGVDPPSGDFASYVDAQKRQAAGEKGTSVVGEEAITLPCGKGTLIELSAPTRSGARIRSMQAWIDAGTAWLNVRASHLDDRKVNADAGPQLRALIDAITLEK